MEARASRRCLERVPDGKDDFKWKPHERSMEMGYVALMVAEIPRWISTAVEVGEVNFGTFKHEEPQTAADLVRQFDANMEGAKKALENVSDKELEEGRFVLKAGEQVLMEDTKKNTVMSSINHLVHHRGQLTVYLRLRDVAVPSIYGPSGDEKTF
jgi:uncharacterized damage-inducible protein DinB